jgi:hypothetical protein
MGQWQLSRKDSSKGANMECRAVEEERLPHEKRRQRPATKCVMHPSCKAVLRMCSAIGEEGAHLHEGARHWQSAECYASLWFCEE